MSDNEADMDELISLMDGEDDTPLSTNFDVSLAAEHEYLGSDLEEVSGRTLLDEGSIVWMPILLDFGVLLVPGQTLPLTVFYPPSIAVLRDVIRTDKTFAITNITGLEPLDGGTNPIGTTAEIFQYQEGSGLAGFKIKAKGRQRFKLLELRMPEPILGRILILPEINLNAPLHEARLISLDRYRKNIKMKNHRVMNVACTTWPSWVIDQYDADKIALRVRRELDTLLVVSKTNIPEDPLNLSYWVTQCLPFDDKHRIKMLSFNTPIERLQYALQLLAVYSVMYCKGCTLKLASRKSVFSMSAEGPQGNYCNPGGYVHEMITVYNAEGMVLAAERPSIEYSWFPGYGWTIASCINCNRHIGWLFTAMRNDLSPSRFWGLSRKAITMFKDKIPREITTTAMQPFYSAPPFREL